MQRQKKQQSSWNSLFLFICLSVFTSNAYAQQQHHNNERGLNAESYANDTIDNVNLYNGNLSLKVPIGQSYNAGGALKYQLMLIYNSSVWDFEIEADRTGDPVRDRVQAIPDKKTNVGLGWNLSLGALYSPRHSKFDNENQEWIYVSADGSEHRFYDSMIGQSNDGKLYTRDGSYIRLTSGERKIEFPDGQIHWFYVDGPLNRMEDRFGNFLQVTIPFASRWEITDTFQRRHVINFNFFGQVTSVEMAAFNGGIARYEFQYEETLIERHRKNQFRWPAGEEMVRVLMLTGVTLPPNLDGSSSGQFSFTYYHDYGADPNTSGQVPGAIETATLPTLGRYRWTYQTYSFVTNSLGQPGLIAEIKFDTRFSSSDGVKTKEVFAPASAPDTWTPIGTWSYKQDPVLLFTNTVTAQLRNAYTKTVVTTPLGDETVNYFHNMHNHWDYALPYAREFPNSDGTMFLSQEIYEGPARKPDGTEGDKRRWVFVRYEADSTSNSLPASQIRDFNRRLAQQRTLFWDDLKANGEFAVRTVSYSNFDGLGHYRQETVDGNFQGWGDSRSVFINYNPPGKPSSNAPWILTSFSERKESEAGKEARRMYCFDSNTGFLNQERILIDQTPADGLTPNDKDVVVRYSHSAESRGAVSREEYFGGDGGGAGLSSCSASGNNKYQIDYTYEFGSLKTKAYADQFGNALSFKLLDRDIDFNTGLPTQERDPAGIADTFEYDNLSRVTLIRPVAGQNNRAWTQYQYITATSGSSLRKLVVRKINETNPNNVHKEQATTYDGFNRAIREEESMANGQRSKVETSYNAMGWKESVSEKQAASLSVTRKTQFLDFDSFGRPSRIIPADGAAHEIRLSYGGIRSMTRSVKIGTTATPAGGVTEETVNTTEIRDHNGRLITVLENSSDPNNDMSATYGYDVGNRLSSVRITARNGTVQDRFFTYDNRGFLLSEAHPELGINPANGTLNKTFYSDYDPRGNAANVREGAVGGKFDLRMSYDRAERLVEIKENGGAGRLLKQFFFGTGQNDADRSNGKVKIAIRHNHHDRLGISVSVTETNTYGGIGGAISQRNTSVSTGQSFTQRWTNNNLGLIQTVTYPECSTGFGECRNTAGANTNRVNYAYSQGYLSAVSNDVRGFVQQTTYHPNGLVNEMTYSSNIKWIQNNDPDSMARTGKITVKNAAGTSIFDSGSYSFDGTGNVIKVGNDRFVYDRFNRLSTAGIDSTYGRWQQTYSYDDFGNLTNTQTTNPSGVTTARQNALSAQTNRLTEMGTSYDDAGNLTGNRVPGNIIYTYIYDSFGMMQSLEGGGNNWVYTYTADDKRIWSYNAAQNRSVWRLRDLDGKVLREYATHAVTAFTGQQSVVWTWSKDYIYHGDRAVATTNASETRNIFTDHLGSPRLITNEVGQVLETHKYLPFGLEAPRSTAADLGSDEQKKFTGHERDANSNNPNDDLDYMQARFYDMWRGRFLSPDSGDDFSLSHPQSWNKYAYVRNNPMNSTDPDGKNGTPKFHLMSPSEFARIVHENSVSTQLPTSGAGFVSYGPEANKFGRTSVVVSLQDFAAVWNQAHPNHPINIGDIALRGGYGDHNRHPKSGHKGGGHVDIRPMTNEGGTARTTYKSSNYNRALTDELVQSLKQIPGVKSIVFNDPQIQGVKRDKKGVKVHDNHLHVQFAPNTQRFKVFPSGHPVP
jgi:RHS repeat-associated protein